MRPIAPLCPITLSAPLISLRARVASGVLGCSAARPCAVHTLRTTRARWFSTCVYLCWHARLPHDHFSGPPKGLGSAPTPAPRKPPTDPPLTLLGGISPSQGQTYACARRIRPAMGECVRARAVVRRARPAAPPRRCVGLTHPPHPTETPSNATPSTAVGVDCRRRRLPWSRLGWTIGEVDEADEVGGGVGVHQLHQGGRRAAVGKHTARRGRQVGGGGGGGR